MKKNILNDQNNEILSWFQTFKNIYTENIMPWAKMFYKFPKSVFTHA